MLSILEANTTLISIGWVLLGAVIGGIATFFITKHMFEKQIKENPPINEKMIRAMYMQMGRKPSEAQIRQIMKSMGQ
ncbi:YneF family protein [Erysipelothrix sp. HDW6B]|uniref:YneF family protein n=1 Tax=Erysipelothrix TaxID=1647 RepID=UPI0013594869|nr:MULTISPECIES: YneF family protein [Erysipelothrix]QIK86397.1 YneF family protein [Erysipelothrix sp. HDW6B]